MAHEKETSETGRCKGGEEEEEKRGGQRETLCYGKTGKLRMLKMLRERGKDRRGHAQQDKSTPTDDGESQGNG